jgi:hypothetical protein
MKKILVASILFASCVFSVSQKINPEQIYQGYPCGTNCDSFQAGFNHARQENLQTNLECGAYPLDQATGCQAAVIENLRGQENFTDLTIK